MSNSLGAIEVIVERARVESKSKNQSFRTYDTPESESIDEIKTKKALLTHSVR